MRHGPFLTKILFPNFVLEVHWTAHPGRPATHTDPEETPELEISECWLLPNGGNSAFTGKIDLQALDLLDEFGYYSILEEKLWDDYHSSQHAEDDREKDE